MTWVDPVVVAIIAALVMFEGRRGAFAAFMDFVAFALAAWLTAILASSFAEAVRLGPAAGYISLYVVLFLLFLVISRMVAETNKEEFGAFESSLGVIFGFCAGVALSFTFTDFLNATANGLHPAVAESFTAPEVHDFRILKAVIHWVANIGNWWAGP